MSIIDTTTVFADSTMTITAHTEPDDTNLFDHMDLDPENPVDAALIEGWKKDEWHFVGVVVTVAVNGIKLGSASLWGIEDGFINNEWVDALTGAYGRQIITDELVPEALEDAQTNLSALAAVKLPETLPPSKLPEIPADYPVKVVTDPSTATDPATCGTCGRTWDDAIITSMTPTPSARCPFEYYH